MENAPTKHIFAPLAVALATGMALLSIGCEPPKIGAVVASESVDAEVEAEAKTFSPIPNKAVVYIYRKDRYIDLSPYLFNGTPVGTLSGTTDGSVGKFIRVVVPEGVYTIVSDMQKGVNIPLVLTTYAPGQRTIGGAQLSAGNVYYIRDEITIVLYVGSFHAFKFMPAEEAQPEILKYRMVHDFNM